MVDAPVRPTLVLFGFTMKVFGELETTGLERKEEAVVPIPLAILLCQTLEAARLLLLALVTTVLDSLFLYRGRICSSSLSGSLINAVIKVWACRVASAEPLKQQHKHGFNLILEKITTAGYGYYLIKFNVL